MMLDADALMNLYVQRRDEIRKRIEEFKSGMNNTEERIFAELCFCLCTPQSRALTCWKTVSMLMENGSLYTGSEDEIMSFLKGVRFRERKAQYIVEARRFFTNGGGLRIKDRLKAFNDVFTLREWLLRNIKGLGMKEASHFMRNIGLGFELAILDRHILKNLKRLDIIKEIPSSLPKRNYEKIERKMKAFADKIAIPMVELDLLLWSMETGMVFR